MLRLEGANGSLGGCKRAHDKLILFRLFRACGFVVAARRHRRRQNWPNRIDCWESAKVESSNHRKRWVERGTPKRFNELLEGRTKHSARWPHTGTRADCRLGGRAKTKWSHESSPHPNQRPTFEFGDKLSLMNNLESLIQLLLVSFHLPFALVLANELGFCTIWTLRTLTIKKGLSFIRRREAALGSQLARLGWSPSRQSDLINFDVQAEQ